MAVRRSLRQFAALMVLGSCTGVCLGATRTWDGSDSTDWFVAGNWAEEAVPVAGDDVMIASGTARLTQSTPVLGSLSLTGTLVFSNWNTTLSAAEITIANGGVATCAGPFTNNQMSNSVVIACSNLTLAAGGRIDTVGKGWSGAVVLGTEGSGPGGGKGDYAGSGGSHGGFAGIGDRYLLTRARPYGDPVWPVWPGSGGGHGHSLAKGGHGGGAIRITAQEHITLNGSILADGTLAGYAASGSGSGGAVLLECRTLSGAGTVSVKGGGPSLYASIGAGGGGRIAIHYDGAAQAALAPGFTGSLWANGGGAPVGGFPGGDGSIWLPDALLIGTRIDSRLQGSLVGLPANFHVAELMITNTTVHFPANGCRLTVDGNLSIVGSQVYVGNTEIYTQTGHRITYLAGSVSNLLQVGGNLSVARSAGLHLYGSCVTNAGSRNGGSVVAVTGTAALESGSWIYPYSHPTNGGSVTVSCGRMVVDATSGINADGRGFFCGATYGAAGFGPGAGVSLYSTHGAAHGGLGGYTKQANDTYLTASFDGFGRPYGSVERPAWPGSGASATSSALGVSDGGGLIDLRVTGDLVCNGRLSADAIPVPASIAASGGSGGGIHIACGRLVATNGSVSARGAASSSYLAGGGGGRIAIHYDAHAEPVSLAIVANGGAGTTAGDLGTIWLSDNALLPENNNARLCGELHGISDWSPSQLTLSNACLRFPGEGYRLNVGGDVLLRNGSSLEMGGGTLMELVMPVHCGTNRAPVFTVGGNLTLASASRLTLWSAQTTNAEMVAGSVLEVAADLLVATNCVLQLVCHPTNGASPRIAANKVQVARGGAVRTCRATAANEERPGGFAWGFSNHSGTPPPGVAYHQSGYGPGGGDFNTREAGSHGGRGAHGSKAGLVSITRCYGDETHPRLPGSGGSSSYIVGGWGGGLAHIVAKRSIRVDGEINMDGMDRNGVYYGPGAGGGIYLYAPRVEGTGLLSAKGGSATGWASGGGGGGRIAVWATTHGFRTTGVTAVNGGLCNSGERTNGEDGSLHWGYIPSEGSVIVLR